VNSCLIPIGTLGGRDIYTVEGIANGKLHPVQQAMVELGGSQCGYCTPGFIMSMFAGYYDGKLDDDVTVEGNLCRCTGYLPIRRAAQQVAAGEHPETTFLKNCTRLLWTWPLPPTPVRISSSIAPPSCKKCWS
jgi:xanthine dehydrogenase small subunit